MKTELSLEQRIHNALGSQKVEEYKARHAYLHGVFYGREEYGRDMLWSESEDVTWGHQFGRMIGWTEMAVNMIPHFDRECVSMKTALMERYPEFIGHDIRSVASSGIHALCSDVIEVAADGRSARSYYYTPGTLMCSADYFDPDSGCRGGQWLWERYGSDFIYDADKGRWLWFHEQVCPDIMGVYDAGDWAQIAYEKFKAQGIDSNDATMDPAHLSQSESLHKMYSIVQTVQDTVPPPRPYAALDDENSYSPGRNHIEKRNERGA